ncbi:MAG: hypothetical protein D6765_11950 [Bacteroidetes bacterium]|nr:MAG: hypothetical protein D6765_11950 [Bacteroidota bacterium]
MKHLLLVIALLSTAALKGQVTASAEVDSNTFFIGDHLMVHLLVNHAPDVVVEDPPLELINRSGLELLQEDQWDTLQSGAEVVLQKDFYVTAWDSGFVRLPALQVPYRQGSAKGLASTQPLLLRVLMPEPDTALAPIKPIFEEPARLTDFLPFLLSVLGFLLLLWVVLRFWRKKEEPPETGIVVQHDPPHVVALRRLEWLERQKLWQQGQLKAYYSELSHILREYLEHRYHFPALESTTGEILETLKNRNMNGELLEMLGEVLHTADLVKFAKAEPPPERNPLALKHGEAFVRRTMRTAAEEEE